MRGRHDGMMENGDVVLERRRKAGLSLSEAEKLLKLSVETIAEYEAALVFRPQEKYKFLGVWLWSDAESI